MNQSKIGELIRTLRTGQNMTQLQLASKLHISDKAVSKWERGFGCPEVSLLPELAQVLQVDLETLLEGNLPNNQAVAGDLKKMNCYVCPKCGNLLIATGPAQLSCCGQKLPLLIPRKAEEGEKLCVERVENEWYITSEHEMVKEHYISFVAFITGDTLLLRKQYPEWNLQTRIPFFAHGTLLWYCTEHGLFYQRI